MADTEEPRKPSIDELKSQIWQALHEQETPPELAELLDRPPTIFDVYFLLERFANLTIWDALNLDSPGSLKPLQLSGMSEHFHIYDRGSCLVMTPKDLFSDTRTLNDAIKTAKAMMQEAYKRNWTVEIVGFDKLERAAWVEAQLLRDRYQHEMSIMRYNVTYGDIRAYNNSAQAEQGAEK